MSAQHRRMALFATFLALIVCANGGSVDAATIKRAGRLTVPANAALVVFSTDPIIHQVLSEDLSAARRSASTGAHSVSTLTVNVSEQQLRPGISLGELAPGDPQVADLIEAAGATAPPVGDTGDKLDEAALARRLAQRNMLPHDSPGQQMTNQFQTFGEFGPPTPCDQRSQPSLGCAPNPEPTRRPNPNSPEYTGDTQQYLQRGHQAARFFHNDENRYQTVIVARATLSGQPEEMTVVAITQPSEDLRVTKKRVAEEIANSVLH